MVESTLGIPVHAKKRILFKLKESSFSVSGAGISKVG